MEKRCGKCGETKAIKEFSKDRHSQDGYRTQCKGCDKIYKQSKKGKAASTRYNKSDKKKNADRRYDESAKGKERDKRYFQSAKGKWATKRHREIEGASEKMKQYKKLYRQSEKGKASNKKDMAVYYTRKTEAGGSYSIDEWFNLCKFYDFHCLKCNKKFLFEKLTVDHIKPVSKGGSSHIWNIQPLCKRCNSKKHNKEIDYRKTLPPWINRDGPVWQQDRLL